jgi:hypothetical protein
MCSTFIVSVIMSLAVSAKVSEYPACSPRTLKDYDLLGPVKSVRVENVEADGQRVLAEKQVFDRTGRLLEARHAVALDSPEHSGYQVFRFHYEPKRRNYETDLFEIDPALGEKPIELQRHIVKFDPQGRCIEERDIDSDGEPNGKNTYEYDSHSDLIREIDRNPDNSIFSIQNRTYSPDHKLLSEKALENRGHGLNYQWSREYRYDSRSNRTEMFSYQQGMLEAHWIYRYDERNRLISSQTIVADPKKDQQVYGKCFDCGLSSGETTYKYNDTGQLAEERVFQPGGNLVSIKKHFYDAHGNSLPFPDAAYVYDLHGNWIKEVPPNRTATGTRYRVIEYYLER